MYAPYTGALQHIKQMLTDKSRNRSTIIVKDFNTPIYINGQIIQTENQSGNTGLKQQADQTNLMGICRIFYTKTEYSFFASVNEIFSRIDQMACHKTRLHKFKKVKLISSIFSNYIV